MVTKTFSNYLIHRYPTCYIDGTINFDAGSFSLKLTKKVGKFAYNMYIELWLGIPGSGGSKIKQLIYYNGRSLASTTNAPSNSVSNSGGNDSFSITKSGTYYLVLACEAPSCSIHDSPENGSIACWVSEGGKTYRGSAFKIQTITLEQNGSAAVFASATGKTIIANASYTILDNTFWAAHTNDKVDASNKRSKLYIWLNDDTANAKMASDSTNVTFTGLANATRYTVHCGCCEEVNGTIKYLTDSIAVTTYQTTVTVNDSGITTTSIPATITVNNDYDGGIEWWTSIDSTKHSAANGGNITISGVTPGQTVTIYAQPSGMSDARTSAVATTLTPTEFLDMNTSITGTTCTFTPQFTSGTTGEISWRANLASQVASGTGSVPAKFEILANGSLYTITFKQVYATDTSGDESVEREIEELSYDIRTYACQLQERDYGSNYFVASIFQTFAAVGPENGYLTELAAHEYDAYCTKRDGNVPNGAHVGYCTISGQQCTVTGLEPSTSYRLYVWLTDCKDFSDYYDAVGYIDFTTKPVATADAFTARVTGKTITITPAILRWNGSSSLAYECYFHNTNIHGAVNAAVASTCNPTSMDSITATGLQNGTKYYVEIVAHDDNGNAVQVDGIEVVTYGIEANITCDHHSSFLEDVEMSYTDGECFAGISQDTSRGANVRWYITPKNETSIIDGVEILNCRRSNPTKFNTNKALAPETEYTFHAYIDGVVYNGENDTVISFNFETEKCANDLAVATDATGETICATPTWVTPIGNSMYELEVTCVLTLDGVTKGIKTTKINGDTLWFTGLERGKTYAISYTAEDNEGNTSANFITYADEESGGVALETTYQLTISDFVYSTKSFQWTCTCNRNIPAGKTIEVYLSQSDGVIYDWDRSMASGATMSYSRLKHNTQTILKVRIKNMRDCNGEFDTVETIRQNTKKLTVTLADCHPHVKVIDSIWQAMANADPYDADPVSGDPITFVDEMCTCEAVLEGKGRVGGNNGTYSVDRTRYFRGLTGGREYLIRIGITDGINTAQSQIYSIYALIQMIRIYDAQTRRFRTALPYIYHDGMWYRAPLYVYHNNQWFDTDPERD